jgi:hypothetical protein
MAPVVDNFKMCKLCALLLTVVGLLCYYYRYSAIRPVRADTRSHSGDWYGSVTLNPGQILGGSLPLLSPCLLCIRLLFLSVFLLLPVYCFTVCVLLPYIL